MLDGVLGGFVGFGFLGSGVGGLGTRFWILVISGNFKALGLEHKLTGPYFRGFMVGVFACCSMPGLFGF